MRLIQGFFCQQYDSLGLGFAGSVGSVVTIKEEFISVMFAGAILHPDNDPSRPLVGGMQDDFGTSALSDIVITPDVIRFVKRYIRNGEPIPGKAGLKYVLHLAGGNIWVGEYTVLKKFGPEVKGPARCVITDVNDDLFKADLRKFAAENEVAEEDPEVLSEEPPRLPLFEAEDDEIPF